ncbi:MAG: superoxide dismutase, Ni [Deltaproteobacteria bacterium]|nr:superoxide dismutase, Ni [Deltaproteobacteria bacterium]HCH64076.1 superoxide dismutase, Ni [Deltaproteobacteria bacterium]
MIRRLLARLDRQVPATTASAHCDGPCGVYDPASARIAAEAAVSMTKKILALEVPDASDKAAYVKYHNTFARYVKIKEEQSHLCKEEILVLWTDFIKPHHVEANPEIHEIFWNAAKLCSTVKVHVSLEAADALMDAMEQIHDLFWNAKNRKVTYYTAS